MFVILVTAAVQDLGLKWVTVLANVSAAATDAVIGDLRPSTGYQFRVSAVNNVGEGSSSQPSNIVVLPQEGECLVYMLLSSQIIDVVEITS